MKIKNFLFIILFLSLNIQLNLKSQNTDNLQKLKSAIDSYNIKKVEEIIESNPIFFKLKLMVKIYWTML